MFGIQRYCLKRPVLIIGFMAAGKTTTAKHMSKMTGVEWTDSDKHIVSSTRRTITEIFNAKGEAGFREHEHDSLVQLVKKKNFVATGGGCIQIPQNSEILAENYCVYLQADLQTLLDRIGDGGKYPMFVDANNAKKLLEQRIPSYEKYANATVNVDNKSVSQVCEEVRKKLLEDNLLSY